MRVEAVIFDCDGVLVDSEPITMAVLTAMANDAGLSLTEHDAAELFMGKSLREDIRIIESHLGKPLPAGWTDAYLARRNAALSAQVVAVTGIVHVLDVLAARGIAIAVASGGDRAKMRLTLGTTGLLHRFEAPDQQSSWLFGADMVEHAKPAPDVYLMAARALNLDPSRCLVIEDTPVGVQAGTAAGAIVFGYCERNDPRKLLAHGASAVFADMHRLPDLLSH